MHTDVAVVGLGAIGSGALWRLAERGLRVTGFEQFQPAHDRGSSHGESRIFRTAYLEGPGYVPLVRRSVELWEELCRLSGEELMTTNGALMLGPPGGSIVRATLRSIRAHDLPHELIPTEELRRRFPGHRILADEVGIRDGSGGFLRPEMAMCAMLRRAEQLGARLVTGAAVTNIESFPDGVRIVLGDALCEARHAVVAVGAWLGKLLPDLRLPQRTTRQVPAWFPVERPDWFAPERFPVFLRDIGAQSPPGEVIAPDTVFYGFPTLDGQTVKVSIHREGPSTDPDLLDRRVAPEELAPVQEFIELFLKGVRPEPVRTSVCMYVNTPDHGFLVGPVRELPNVTILAGLSGHGFKFAPALGEAAADFATQGKTSLPVGFLSPERFEKEG